MKVLVYYPGRSKDLRISWVSLKMPVSLVTGRYRWRQEDQVFKTSPYTVQSQAGLHETLSHSVNESKIKECKTVLADVHDCLEEETQGCELLGEKRR